MSENPAHATGSGCCFMVTIIACRKALALSGLPLTRISHKQCDRNL
ncbi:hypothetical protein [Sphaerospermopsis torques-reginae]|uniref:Uncharacterized protein n=1 Tax=Sphaerospermopsis torques-reginae ITEP-024 TaxID=984208 RepID=A0ABX8X2S2_9CYAN|nr:hypothetical protein [Sphaerospermopsis torques-reginae]QYX32823.1 hypothetical protein K2F26_05585 [Sphaerospermopsis torques-reginae ITEP-024]